MSRQRIHLKLAIRTPSLNNKAVKRSKFSSKMSPRKAIDAWCQMAVPNFLRFVPEVKRLLMQSKSPMAAIGNGLTAEQTIHLMDKAGVDKLCLSAWYRPDRIVISNEMIFEWTKKYPERFIGIGGVDLLRPRSACLELEKAVRDYGFKGLRVVPWLWKLPPNDKHYYPLFVKCIELDIPFFTQVGHTGPLMPSETGRPIPYLDEVALTFPELRIVGGHIGYPWTNEMIAMCWKHENVYLDTSAYLPAYYPPELIHYMKTYGQDKVCYGSNFPQLQWKQTMEQVSELKLPADVEEKFLYKNICKILKI